MILKNEDITLQSALQEYGLRELPPEWNPNTSTLVDGIALVTKATGQEYCKVANKNGKVCVIKDYGRTSVILRVEKIFAVNTITKADVPRLRNDNEIIQYLGKCKYPRSEIEQLLSMEGKTESQIASDRAEIERRINDLALEFQKKKIEEEVRVKKIKEFAEAAKAEKQKQKTNGRRKKKID